MRRWLMVTGLLLGSLWVRTNEYTRRAMQPEQKLVLVTLDGFRWQELFGGADAALLQADNAQSARLSFSSTQPATTRETLLPFFWGTVARQGALYGNRRLGNKMNVSNPYALSYPGYAELLTGAVDLFLFNNGKAYNAHPTLLDELNAASAYRGKVAAFASWDAFPYILNSPRSRVYLDAGKEGPTTETVAAPLPYGMDDPKHSRRDEETVAACRRYLKEAHPSVVFLSLGGTDEAAHQQNYKAYLQQAATADRLLGELWQWLQTDPAYRGQTTLVITTDHGRGAAAHNWHTHGLLVPGSSQTWMALLGPAVQPYGEVGRQEQRYTKDIKPLLLSLLSTPQARP